MVSMKALSASTGVPAAATVSNQRSRQQQLAPVPAPARPFATPQASKPDRHGIVSRAAVTDRPVETKDSKDVPGLIDTVWEQKKMQQPPRFPKLDRDLEVDVCIVGAGITGLSIAYALAKEGKSVAVLEARVIGAGQTGRTTAHLMPWNDDYYALQKLQLGEEKLKILGESHKKSIDWVENTIKAEGIDCKFERVDAYLIPYSDSPVEWLKLENELPAAHDAGLTDVQWADLGGDPAAGSVKRCLKFPNAADFHPLMYINGLADAIASDKYGGHIFEMTRVADQDGKVVKTWGGHKVVAKDAVVLATNSPIHQNLALHPRQHPSRSYVLGFEVPKGSVKKMQWWSTASPYHYVRIEEQDDHDILVVGGGDHLTGPKPSEYPPSYESIEEFARKRWTSAGEIKYRWTGQVMEPADLIGHYGLDPLNPAGDTYIATGDSGQGMTGGTIAAIVISQQILGMDCPWKPLYDPGRIPASPIGLVQLADEAKTTIESYADILLPKLPKGLDSVEPGSGAVLQVGFDKVAAYREEDGTLKTWSAVCPHLKCSVMYNPKDNTFDCPCHGSHFDTNGECINGPARRGLYPVSGEDETVSLKDDK